MHSYSFRVQLSDGTADATMTCFSNEANSMVTDCKELLKTIPDQSSYEYPAEILSLQGKRKIFQLHFDLDSTKEKQIFILDTCWDAMPLLTSTDATIVEPNIEFPEAAGLATNKTPPATPATTTPNITIPHTETTATVTPDETYITPPPKESSPSEQSQSRKQAPRKSTRRALFAEDEDQPAASGGKKTKKHD